MEISDKLRKIGKIVLSISVAAGVLYYFATLERDGCYKITKRDMRPEPGIETVIYTEFGYDERNELCIPKVFVFDEKENLIFSRPQILSDCYGVEKISTIERYGLITQDCLYAKPVKYENLSDKIRQQLPLPKKRE